MNIKNEILGAIITVVTSVLSSLIVTKIGEMTNINFFSKPQISYFAMIIIAIIAYLVGRFFHRKKNDFFQYDKNEKRFLNKFGSKLEIDEYRVAYFKLSFNKLDNNRLFLSKLDIACNETGNEINIEEQYGSSLCNGCEYNSKCVLYNNRYDYWHKLKDAILSKANSEWRNFK